MNALLFHNAVAVTMDPARPRAEAVAVRDGRIVAVGDAAQAARALDGDAERIDCRGGVLLPGFIDAHCHLLAYAATLRSIDCTGARSIADVQEAIRLRARYAPPGRWLRAFGYEETSLRERRHPDRYDLDAAAPDHPVRLIHSSGHARVLNSLALRLVGIGVATEEPPGAVIERSLDTGEPSGVLIGMEDVVDRAVPSPPYDELAAAVRQASRRLLAVGITCFQDATHTNGRAAWDLFERLLRDRALPVDAVVMEGADYLGELPECALDGRLRRGPVKVMLHELEHSTPGDAELASMARAVRAAHDAGRQVAVHAASEPAVRTAVDAIDVALRARPRDDERHRIEHCGLLPDGAAERMAALGVVVVSQPSFVYERGERYLQLVPEEQHDRLYAFRALRDAGVTLAAGSDAPVAPPAPMAAVASAVDRRTRAGRSLGAGQAVAMYEALSWWTAGAARAAFLEGDRGSLRPGLRADLVLWPPGTLEESPGELRRRMPLAVWVKGRPVQLDHNAEH